MATSFRRCLTATLFCMLAMPVIAQDRVIRLVSLEWPPYAGENVDEQGASVAVARAAAQAMGYSLDVKFFPWNRAVGMAKDANSGVHGYFPEYFSAEIARDFVLSDPIGSGPLGFMEQTAHPVSWATLADLEGKPIGTVSGYVNTAEFDAKAASGEIKVESVGEDLTNIKKVGVGRIPLAVIDKNVLQYLLAHEPSLASLQGMVQFNAKPLEDKQLYIAFQRSTAGAEAARVINEGLKKIDATAIAAKFFQ